MKKMPDFHIVSNSDKSLEDISESLLSLKKQGNTESPFSKYNGRSLAICIATASQIAFASCNDELKEDLDSINDPNFNEEVIKKVSIDLTKIQSRAIKILTGADFEIDPDIKYDYIVKKKNDEILGERIKEIVSFKSLVNSWDGYGAIPAEVESTANSILFLKFLKSSAVNSINSIYPNPHGTITFNWERGENSVDVEVGNSELTYIYTLNGNNTVIIEKARITQEVANNISEKIESV